MKKNIHHLVIALVLTGFFTLGFTDIVKNREQIQLSEIKLQSTTSDLKSLQLKFDSLNIELDKALHEDKINEEKVQQLEQQRQELEKQKQELERQLQAKKQLDEANRKIANAVTLSSSASASSQCGDNEYAYSIYKQESGCRLGAINPSSGACGIGQSLPCSKLSSVCPNWQNDYACQNAFFTNYAMSYGSWQAAYNFKYCIGNCYSTRTKITTYKHEVWW